MILAILPIWAEDNTSLHFYPVLDYAEETSLSGGGALIYLFRPKDQPKSVPPSLMKIQVKAGIRKSWSFELENEWQFDEGKYAINLPFKLEQEGCNLYGTGDEIEIDQSLENEFRHFQFSYEMLRRWSKYNFGFTYKGNYYKYADPIEEHWLLYEARLLSAGGWSLGPGLTFQYNTLDNQYFPVRGLHIQFDLQTFSEALSSDYTFDRYSLSATGYLPVKALTTWATELKIIASAGEIPYQELASLGTELRIFQNGQYMDKSLISLSTEIRSFPWSKPHWRRLGMVFFAETGQVRKGLDEFYISGFRYGFGIGFRYLLDVDELFTLRLDTGVYKKQTSTDFGAREAF